MLIFAWTIFTQELEAIESLGDQPTVKSVSHEPDELDSTGEAVVAAVLSDVESPSNDDSSGSDQVRGLEDICARFLLEISSFTQSII